MSRVYTASDYSFELQRTFPQCNFTLELLITELDLISIEGSILDLVNEKVSVTIVISAMNQNKSLRVVNLLNRIINSGGLVYWNTDEQLYENDIHFAIQDKELGIKKSDFYLGEGNEGKLITLNQLFDSSRNKANQIELLNGEIEVNFRADKTFVKRNNEVELNWDVKNAHNITLIDHLESAEPVGKISLTIKEDSTFKLEARNRDRCVENQLVVKVLKSNALEITVEAYDTYLNEYVPLKSIEENLYEFLAFSEQRIRLSWANDSIGSLSEDQLGSLPLVGEHDFKLSQTFDFKFKFQSIYGDHYTYVNIKPVSKKEQLEGTEEESASLFTKLTQYFKK